MTNLGFKKLTIENWLEPDKLSSSFVRISLVDEQVHPFAGNEWVRYILKPSLTETVPTEVRALFEVARGALVYGYLFYPLYTLAGEQLFRVAETAVILKCKALGAPRSIKTFQKKVEYLTCNKVIPEQEKEDWRVIWKLRNKASHPEGQNIFLPSQMIEALKFIADRINSLFSSE